MGRYREQATSMKGRRAGTKHSGSYGQGRTSLRRRLRAGTLLCFALLALHGSAQGQEPWQKKVVIDVEKQLTEPAQFRLAGKEPQANTELEFKGSGRDWNLIRFDRLPENVELRVKGEPTGYKESEELRAERYYAFKLRLPVVLEIRTGARMPVELGYWLGAPTAADAQEQLKSPELTADKIRQFIDTNYIDRSTERQALKFSWNAPITEVVVPLDTPTSASTTLQPPITTHESSWWTYLTYEEPMAGIIVLIVGLILLAALMLKILPVLIDFVQEWLRRRRKRLAAKKMAAAAAKPNAEGDMYESLGSSKDDPVAHKASTTEKDAKQVRHTSLGMTAYDSDQDPPFIRKKNRAQEERPQRTRGAEISEPSPRVKQEAELARHDGRRVADLEKRLGELEAVLGQKVDRRDKLTEAATVNVGEMLRQTETIILNRVGKMIEEGASSKVQPVMDMLVESESSIKKELGETARQLRQVAGEGERVKEELLNVLTQLGLTEGRLKERFSELDAALRRQAVPDSFYAKTLGAVLGQNIEVLQDGNFDRQVVERINQFFQTGVARGEVLQDLRARAEGINAALKDLSAQMEKLNPQATDEARTHAQRAEALFAELSGLQFQLQNRRATVETTLRIPVSMHAGARQTFLDELGRGIRRELDKLHEPESYFEGELERLITADLIAIVDICDRKVAPPPGARAELEVTLKQLFEKAGLRPILPQRGEPFKTAEQDLIEMAQGGGQSLTVAQVITRGFYYKHNGNETLLRKAGVSVYR